MYKHFSLLLRTLHVPLHIGKCTTRGICTPLWELLLYMDSIGIRADAAYFVGEIHTL